MVLDAQVHRAEAVGEEVAEAGLPVCRLGEAAGDATGAERRVVRVSAAIVARDDDVEAPVPLLARGEDRELRSFMAEALAQRADQELDGNAGERAREDLLKTRVFAWRPASM